MLKQHLPSKNAWFIERYMHEFKCIINYSPEKGFSSMTTSPTKIKLYRLGQLLLILFLCILFLVIAVRVVDPVEYPNSDFFSFWLAGRMMWTGQNPYATTQWIEGHHQFGATWISDPEFLYPLPLALFMAPLGLLSLYNAYIVWVVLLQCMIAISVFFLLRLRTNPKLKHYIFPAVVGIILFRPVFITLYNGQLSGILLLISALVIHLWGKEKWWQGGVILPLLALKPNVGIPMLALLSFWLLIQKKYRLLVWMILSAIALLIIGLIRDPNWVAEYLTIGNAKLSQTFGYSPTIWGLAAYLSGFKLDPTLIFGGLAAVIILGGCLSLLITKRAQLSPALACSLIIVTTLLITPYTWTYDQLLLIIPIIVTMLEMMDRQYPFLLSASLFLLYDVLTIFLLVISARIEMEVLNSLIPLIIYCTLFPLILSMKYSDRHR